MVQLLMQTVSAYYRLRFIVHVRILAAFKRSTVNLSIDRGVKFGGSVDITVSPRSTTSIAIGDGTRVGRDVRLVLDGGSMTVGRRAIIRAGVVIHVRGDFVMEDRTLLSYYSVVHCDESIVLRTQVGLGEHLTITDSRHRPAEPGDWWYNQIETAPVEIGRDVWGGSKLTITSGVTIGDGCILAAGSVISKDVPPDTVVGGVPARVLGTSNLRDLLT